MRPVAKSAVRLLCAALLLALLLASRDAFDPRVVLAQDELGAELEGDAAEGLLTDGLSSEYESAQPESEPATSDEVVQDEPVEPHGEEHEASSQVAAGQAADPATGALGSSRAIALRMSAGFGVGSFSYTRPTPQGAQQIAESPHAAAELALRVHAWPRERFSLETLLTYQTSMGLSIELPVLFGLPERLAARTQRLELSVAPVLRLGDSPRAVAFAFPIGFAYRTFVPEEHQYQVPRYSLGGPLLRAEATIHLGDVVRLRGGPEAQWIVLISPSLSDEGACCQGLGFAGAASLEADLGASLRVALAYREARSSIPLNALFKDVERLLVVRLVGEL